MPALLLSAVIITLNEERNIGRCLDSLKGIADEIIVVDSFSTDETEKICRTYGARFIQHKFEGHIQQKNYALSLASHPLTLSLDADEALDKTLQKSILEVKTNPEWTGYTMNRLTNYCGKWVHHCGWYPDTKLRLVKTGKAQFKGINPHDKLEFIQADKSLHLKGDILHYSYYTRKDHLKQIEFFGNIAAKELFLKGKTISILAILLKVVAKFIHSFFIKTGFLDGQTGLTISSLSAYATYVKYTKLRDLHTSAEFSNKGTRFIISRTDSIGDVMLTLPLCNVLKKKFPDCYILFLGRTYTADIISCCNGIDEFLNWDEILELSLKDQITLLKGKNADVIIHVFPVKKIVELAKKAGIKTRIATGSRFFTLTQCNKLVFYGRKNSNLHESQLNLKLLSPLGIKSELTLNEMPAYYGFSNIPYQQKEKVVMLIKDVKNKKRVILHPFSKASAVEWGIVNYRSLISELSENEFEIYITGTQSEGDRIEELGGLKGSNIINLTGKLTLLELIAFIGECDALVAASTGPLHIAAALGIHAIGLYTPKRPMHPGRWAPVGIHAHIISAQKHPEPGQFLNISPSEVASILKEIPKRNSYPT